MELNYGNRMPIYEQIKEKTKEYIINGAMAENEQIPSVREVASKLAINPNTIQRAYKELESEGYIYSIRAKGYFVAPIRKSVKEVKKEEAFERLEKDIRELKYLDVEKEKIIEIINKIFD